MPFILLIQPPKKMNNKITMNKNKRNPKKKIVNSAIIITVCETDAAPPARAGG